MTNDGIFKYARHAVSDCNRDYIKESFAKREFHSSQTKLRGYFTISRYPLDPRYSLQYK